MGLDYSHENSHEIDKVSFGRLSEIIREESGISLSENKRNLVVSRLARRLRQLGLSTFAQYCDLLQSPGSSGERRELVCLLTTNVTRFFREKHHFEALQSEIFPKIAETASKGDQLRIWSAGCSTGQEPYSLAMTVLDSSQHTDGLDTKILATDIDTNVLRAAKSGVYQLSGESDMPDQFHSRFFHEKPDESASVVADDVRSLVTFRELNLMKNWPMKGKFDIIFCRNTVIYFDADTQARLWERFANILKPGGSLFVGHSERVSGLAESAFHPVGVTQYRRQ